MIEILVGPGGRRRRPAVITAIVLGLASAAAGAGAQTPPDSADPMPTWRVEASAPADLWFHSLAVVGADEPGPLGLYSADYAQRIRTLKQQAGIFPTMLDSLAPELRRAFLDDENLSVLHFAPLYFARTDVAGMLDALLAVAERKTDDKKLAGRNLGPGMRRIAFDLRTGGSRRTLKTLVQAVHREWEVFYHSHRDSLQTAQSGRYRAMQAVWDSVIARPLTSYLAERRLRTGVVMPSPGIGPEGRIIPDDPLAVGVPRNMAAVMMPLFTEAPEPSAFALLKELCFPIVGPMMRRLAADTSRFKDRWDFEDLERRAAVRCGAMLLQFYAPTLAAKYRRAFLDAVGATESYTVAAFERVYPLDPRALELLRQEIRRR